MRVLVTGAAGFIGSHLTHALIARNARVCGIVSQHSDTYRLEPISRDLELARGDIRDQDFIRQTVGKVQPELIYHLADYGIHSGQTDLQHMTQVNVLGLTNLLGALQDIPFRCFVSTGTSAEYGPKKNPMKEEDLLEPATLYGASKAAATHLLQAYGKLYNKKMITLRLFYVYGPGEGPNRLIPTAIRHCMEGTELKLTSMKEKRDFVYIEDVVEACLMAASKSVKHSAVVNIGTSVESTLGEALEILERCLGKTLRVQEGSYEKRQWESPCWAADIKKAKEVLGWTPKHDLAAGLQKTIAANSLREMS